MSELKILSHLGSHPNVLALLGAVTKNIHLRKDTVYFNIYCTVVSKIR
jgi:hypothetical protein